MIAGISEFSGLEFTAQSVRHHGDSEQVKDPQSPGRSRYEAIILGKGVTHDPEFQKWASRVRKLGLGTEAEGSLKIFRKNLVIDFYNETGQVVAACQLYRCWVSEYQALPALDAGTNAVAIEMIKLENEGWERNEKDD